MLTDQEARRENREYIGDLIERLEEHKPEWWATVSYPYNLIGFFNNREERDMQINSINEEHAKSSNFKSKYPRKPASASTYKQALRILKIHPNKYELFDWSDFEWANDQPDKQELDEEQAEMPDPYEEPQDEVS